MAGFLNRRVLLFPKGGGDGEHSVRRTDLLTAGLVIWNPGVSFSRNRRGQRWQAKFWAVFA